MAYRSQMKIRKIKINAEVVSNLEFLFCTVKYRKLSLNLCSVCVFYVWLFGWGALNFSNVYLVIHFDAPHIPSNNDFVYMFVCVLPHTLLFNDYGLVSTQEFSQCLHSRINVFKCIERQMSISQHTQNLNIYSNEKERVQMHSKHTKCTLTLEILMHISN